VEIELAEQGQSWTEADLEETKNDDFLVVDTEGPLRGIDSFDVADKGFRSSSQLPT